jgi:DNA-binding PadR family transcriptional regulator
MSVPDPKPAERSSPIMLSPTSYLMLGMVRLGVSSGYAIKKAADGSTQNFWPISLALVYPELARLEQGGLLRRRSDPRGGRARSAYTITTKGEKALGAWLRSPKVAPVQIRDEAMLKLFLADALDSDDQRELIRGLRERNRERREALEREAVPRAGALEAQGIRYVAAAARLSADLLRYAEGWLGRLERKLEDD